LRVLDFSVPFELITNRRNTATKKDKQHVILIGAGFAGMATAANLLLKYIRGDLKNGLEITHIERYENQRGGGIAYSTEGRLNLSANRVGLMPETSRPAFIRSFIDYIIEVFDERAAEKQLNDPERRVFGGYSRYVLDTLIDKAVSLSNGKVSYKPVTGEVIGIKDHGEVAEVQIKKPSGEVIKLRAGNVVLSTGHYQLPEAPKELAAIAKHRRFLPSIYKPDALKFLANLPKDENEIVLVVGTGLSANDNVLRLLESGYKGKIIMMSRRGLSHLHYNRAPINEFLRDGLVAEPDDPRQNQARGIKDKTNGNALKASIPLFMQRDSLSRAVGTIKGEFVDWMKQGYTTEEILGHWEAFAYQLKEKFSGQEKALGRMRRRMESVLSAYRVGVIPDIHEKLSAAIKSGQLQIIKGTITATAPIENSEAISVSFNANRQKQTIKVTAVMSGLPFDVATRLPIEKINDPLWRSMLQDGTVVPHHMNADGIEVSSDFAIINSEGRVSKTIHGVGVPISGHMGWNKYRYPEKPGAGSRLGSFTLNVAGITGQADLLTDVLARKVGINVIPANRHPDTHPIRLWLPPQTPVNQRPEVTG